jgi:hypothetical protein
LSTDWESKGRSFQNARHGVAEPFCVQGQDQQ